MTHSRSGSTATTAALHHADTKSTLAQDDENNSDATNEILTPPSISPESLSSETNAIPTAKLTRNRAKAKSDHAKYEKKNKTQNFHYFHVFSFVFYDAFKKNSEA